MSCFPQPTQEEILNNLLVAVRNARMLAHSIAASTGWNVSLTVGKKVVITSEFACVGFAEPPSVSYTPNQRDVEGEFVTIIALATDAVRHVAVNIPMKKHASMTVLPNSSLEEVLHLYNTYKMETNMG